ncbi:MAG: acyl carrier protein [Candidatus Polarisedimenticolaceae bacterium]|nr:acyl carrier protein [Candidatus Polarisedimenticolaceae bacterium]
MSTEVKLRSYILESYLFSDDQSLLDNADSFMEKGILDSTGIMEVIFYLEDEFGIQVEDEEMVPENLDSINNILAFLDSKK